MSSQQIETVHLLFLHLIMQWPNFDMRNALLPQVLKMEDSFREYEKNRFSTEWGTEMCRPHEVPGRSIEDLHAGFNERFGHRMRIFVKQHWDLINAQSDGRNPCLWVQAFLTQMVQFQWRLTELRRANQVARRAKSKDGGKGKDKGKGKQKGKTFGEKGNQTGKGYGKQFFNRVHGKNRQGFFTAVWMEWQVWQLKQGCEVLARVSKGKDSGKNNDQTCQSLRGSFGHFARDCRVRLVGEDFFKSNWNQNR